MSSSPRTRRHRASTSVSPVVSRRPDPEVWRRALALAGGDVHRLTVAADGTVRVGNAPRR